MEHKQPPDRIETERLRLERHRLETAPILFRCVDDDRKRLREFLPWVDQTTSLSDEVDYVQMTVEKWSKHELFDYGIYDRTTGAYMGNIGVHSIAWDHARCELGYWILGGFEGKGYMSESVRAIEGVFFGMGFKRIEIRCNALNERSKHVPMANGYALEGKMRSDAVEYGEFRDTLVFGKLQDEWLQGTSKTNARLANFAGLDSVLLFVEDIARSRDWYRGVLEINPQLDLPHFVEFRLGSHSFCLHQADALKSPVSTGGQVAYWHVHDFKGSIDRFLKAGAVLHRGPIGIGNGLSICQLRDPFGSVIGLHGKSPPS